MEAHSTILLPGAPDNGPPTALRSVRVRIVIPVRYCGPAQGRVPIGRVIQGRHSALGLYLKLKDIATDLIPCCAKSSSRDMQIRDTSHPDALWIMGNHSPRRDTVCNELDEEPISGLLECLRSIMRTDGGCRGARS